MTIPLQLASLCNRQAVFVRTVAGWILARTSSLLTWSLYEMRSILRQHLISMACILLWSSAVRVHDSQAEDSCCTQKCVLWTDDKLVGCIFHYQFSPPLLVQTTSSLPESTLTALVNPLSVHFLRLAPQSGLHHVS